MHQACLCFIHIKQWGAYGQCLVIHCAKACPQVERADVGTAVDNVVVPAQNSAALRSHEKCETWLTHASAKMRLGTENIPQVSPELKITLPPCPKATAVAATNVPLEKESNKSLMKHTTIAAACPQCALIWQRAAKNATLESTPYLPTWILRVCLLTDLC